MSTSFSSFSSPFSSFSTANQTAPAGSALPIDQYLVFADGLTVGTDRRAEIGSFKLAGDGVLTAQFSYYDYGPSVYLPAYQSNIAHNQMDINLVPYQITGTPGLFQTPQPTGVVNLVGSWTRSGNTLTIDLSNLTRVWQLSADGTYYLPVAMSGSVNLAGC